MNYLRGAVNAISAPYQYYKDINPATLTGAIDVIVIQRPSDNGGTELACSPFHVRFGKWQVLRPNEKMVTVSVNGRPIPFDMKIGEAGEAFFIFETDDDVPDDLITSPILRASSPSNDGDTGEETDRFGAKKDTEEPEPLDLNAPPSPPDDDIEVGESYNAVDHNVGSAPTSRHRPSASTSNVSTSLPSQPTRRRSSTISGSTPQLPSPPPSPTRTQTERELDERADAALKQTAHRVHVPEVTYHDGIALDAEGYHFKETSGKSSFTEIYSGHDRERSDRTIRADDDSINLYAFPRNSSDNLDFNGPHLVHTQSQPNVPDNLADSDIDSTDTDPNDLQFKQHHSRALSLPFPTRATSEPPPELSIQSASPPPSANSSNLTHFSGPGKLNVLTPVQEYSWEWGAFPQPSPMKTSFSKSGRLETGLGLGVGAIGAGEGDDYELSNGDLRQGRTVTTWGRAPGKSSRGRVNLGPLGLSTVDSDDENEHPNLRSRSVPPGLDESPTRDRKRESRSSLTQEMLTKMDDTSPSRVYGTGGKLGVSQRDPTLFKVLIDGKRFEFELSLVEYEDDERDGSYDDEEYEDTGGKDADEELEPRGRQAHLTRGSSKSKKSTRHIRVFSPDGRWPGIDEFETARLFEKGKVSFEEFIENDQLLKDPRLVISWTRQQYISQRDESPLMGALSVWRDSYIQRKGRSVFNRPISPSSALSEDSELEDDILSDSEGKKTSPGMERAKSEPPEIKEHGVKSLPPTSSSWVQWWRRSQKTPSSTNAGSSLDTGRPELKEAYSAPSVGLKKRMETSTPDEMIKQGSAPALPSTPVKKSISEPQPLSRTSTPKKYAKTLRLTSDQLKSLNLKPGPNSITFSLSATGTVACTARVFLWHSTDLVVISDIDGTITKSDGLGHVFAMIGRDWTHLGVAKLYTDICRNGYKVLYLTSRAIGQADATRGYLKGIKQNDYQLPEGPVIMSPDRLMASLHREVIMRKPEVFKMACLRDIQRLFGEASRNPFYAGFGNRITDALSYRSVNVPSSRIFTIDSSSEVKLELLELAGYKSSYIHMTDLVDQMFPPIHRKWAPEFTDFNFWKPPMQEFPLPDFSPPSPALSARSDGSAFARLRNFSLVGGRQGNISRTRTMMIPSSSRNSDGEPLRNATLQQMSSFERLGSTLGFSGSKDRRRSESPSSRSYSSSYTGSEDEDEEGGWRHGRRERRRSMTSMPGSLEEMDLDDDPEEDEVEYIHSNNGDYVPDDEEEMDEAAAEDTFDDDLLAAGEMKNVPFL
ncbi:hypothetical protein D9757_001254 [Collybiopsis confluens]|uniref:phosphatidate phosphatase n=1 Tax=Collybiopsis confluens TaxID=2823264 RepID=A0A8H5I0S4_9AGAR|nr:hypothetical protein D9757_001254 [Collybiopsis confluens]